MQKPRSAATGGPRSDHNAGPASANTGPRTLPHGFRPFFLGAALWATLAMALWLPMLSGAITLPSAFDPVSWHAHEFLYGYLGAVVAGFLLTAVPNWTGRLPLGGWRLGGLVGLWLLGRAGVAVSDGLPPLAVALLDLAFPVVLWLAIGREIAAGKNWRNLIILVMFGAFSLGNAIFHWEAAQGAFAAQGHGLRLGLGAAIMMIAVVGGRVVPSFTRNWLVKQGSGRLPAPPMQRFDQVALLVLLVALLAWVLQPSHAGSGAALVLAGLAHAVRLARWAGERTGAEPLVLVLHVGYAFVPLGALALGIEILAPGILGMAAAQHLWMGGAVGLMTLAVMTRATLGHSGQPLSAGPRTVAIYAALVVAVLARVAAGIWPAEAGGLNTAAGLAWIATFAGFVAVYGKWLACWSR